MWKIKQIRLWNISVWLQWSYKVETCKYPFRKPTDKLWSNTKHPQGKSKRSVLHSMLHDYWHILPIQGEQINKATSWFVMWLKVVQLRVWWQLKNILTFEGTYRNMANGESTSFKKMCVNHENVLLNSVMEMSISMRWIIKKFFWWRGLYGCLALTELKTCRESWKGMFTLRNLITNVELSSYNAACYIWRYTTALEMNGWMNFNIIFTTWRIFIILNIIFVDTHMWVDDLFIF